MVWERELDIYGKVKTETQESANFVPFRYQEQYYDSEVDLCYNRFRYYDCNTGTYISQDPIGLIGENPTMYGYVFDSNTQIDPLGLHIASAVYTNSQGVVGEVGKFDSLGGVHSEPKILSQMGNQKGGHLEIISLGPKGDGSKSFFRNPNGSVYPAGPLPPCSFRSKNCDALLHSYAKSNNMTITYKWDNNTRVYHPDGKVTQNGVDISNKYSH